MATINKDLKEYLSQQNKKSSITEKLLPDAPKLSAFSWFKTQSDGEELEGSNSNDVNSSWLKEGKSDPFCPSLTKRQRILGFIGCNLMGIFCFVLAWLFFPFLVVKARKFAILYTFGSLFMLSSYALLWGPVNHLKHIFSKDRLPFTTVYFTSMFATLYFALYMRSTVFTAISAVCQVLALLWYIISYIPGGNTGLKFFSKIFYAASSKAVNATLPV